MNTNKKGYRRNKTTEPLKRESERDKIGSYLWNKNLRDYALYYFMLNTGRRISDALKLDVKDVAFMDKSGKFCIAERLKIYEKKTGKYANILINNTARRALKKYLMKRKKQSRLTGKSMAEFLREPLFSSQKPRRNGEKRLTEPSAWRIFNGAAKNCGICWKIGTHSLRKTCGYLLYERGTSIELIQKIFNHSSPEITLSYIGIMQENIDEAFLSLENYSNIYENQRFRREQNIF